MSKINNDRYKPVITLGGQIVYIKKPRKFSLFNCINLIILTIFALLCIFPIVYEVLLSFSSRADYLSANIMVFPNHFNFESYKSIIFQGRVLQAFGISIFLVVVSTLYSMILTCLGAYAFTRKDVPGMKIIFTLIIFTMFFGGGLIPFYFIATGLLGTNNLLILILPFGINTFNMIVLRNFFAQVPESILESCRLDGANEFQILLQFVIPLSKAGLATIMLYYIVAKWDDWYWPMLFLTKRTDLFPLALELRSVLTLSQSEGYEQGGNVDWSIIFAEGRNAAMICISLLPIMCAYPFLQKYFTKGVMIGGVKS